MREFVDLKKIYPNTMLGCENYLIFYGKMSEKEVQDFKTINAFKPWYNEAIEANVEYVTLFKKNEKAMMSDVPMEKKTNKKFIDKANGHVLIFGLGLGMIILPLLKDDNIKSITIIEIDEGLIELVGNIIKPYDIHNKLTILKDDAFLYHEKLHNEKFDSIYFDIWISIVAENLPEMDKLYSSYQNFLNTDNPNSFMDSWCYDYCKGLYNKE